MLVHSRLAHSCFAVHVIYWFVCGLHSHMDETWTKPHLIFERLPATREIQQKGNHDRNPDVGFRISVSMQYGDGSDGACIKTTYIAEYCGHGASKTAFILNGAIGDPFNGKILKVTTAYDTEPSVFGQMETRCPGSTLKILYNAFGFDEDEGGLYYCWITDRAIPLDQLMNSGLSVDRERCVLAVLMLTSRCGLAGLRLSDCGFFNFGVLVDKADAHTVVCIDAGSYGLAEPYPANVPGVKRKFTEQVVNKILKKAKHAKVPTKRLHELYHRNQQLEPAMQVLETEWKKRPCVSAEKTTTEQLERDLNGEVLREKTNSMGSAAFKVLNAIGRYFDVEWTEPLALEWFKAAEKTRRELDQRQWESCEELHSRLTRKGAPGSGEQIVLIDRTPEEFSEGMKWWWRLKKFRDSKFAPGEGIPEDQAWKAVHEFAELNWRSKLTPAQNKAKKRKRTYHAMLHQRLFHKLAAVAIMQVDIPLPGTQTDFHGEDAIDGERKTPWQEVMEVKLKQARGMGQWLTCYAQLARKHRDTEQYQNDHRDTPQITGEKWLPRRKYEARDKSKSTAGHGSTSCWDTWHENQSQWTSCWDTWHENQSQCDAGHDNTPWLHSRVHKATSGEGWWW